MYQIPIYAFSKKNKNKNKATEKNMKQHLETG